MPCLLSLTQVVLLSSLLFQYTVTFPSGGRHVEGMKMDEDDDSFVNRDNLSCRRCLFPRDNADIDCPAAKDRGCRRSELQTRQLGDLEFTNRYAEMLKSQAKLSSLCSFLRRMQNSKKSSSEAWLDTFNCGLTGDTERVNTLMKQYMCASVYQ